MIISVTVDGFELFSFLYYNNFDKVQQKWDVPLIGAIL